MKGAKIIRSIFKSLGYELVNLKSGLGKGTPENELLKILQTINTDLVLDIGANRGQFGTALYGYGYAHKMLSFEPLSKAYAELEQNAKGNANWSVYERCCVGHEEGETVIQVSALQGNSSVLDMKSTPFNVRNSAYIAKETVPQITLGTLNTHLLIQSAKNIFVKMDIQGFEHFVLSALPTANYKINGFYIELSLVKLYDGQEDYLYICNQLKKLGYDLVYVQPESIRSNRMIQFNGIFLHESLSYTA